MTKLMLIFGILKSDDRKLNMISMIPNDFNDNLIILLRKKREFYQKSDYYSKKYFDKYGNCSHEELLLFSH